MKVLSVVVATLIVLALSWGCATPKPPVPAGGPAAPAPEATGVVTLDIFGFPMAENWDADPEVDGIEVEIWPKDAEDLKVEVAGTVSAKLWLQSILEPEKGELIQTWTDIPVSKDNYGFLSGARVRLEYSGFTPTEEQWGILEVTFTTTDGKGFTARAKGIHLGE